VNVAPFWHLSEKPFTSASKSGVSRFGGIVSRPIDELDKHRVSTKRLEITVLGQGVRLGVAKIDRFLEVMQRSAAITAQCGDAGHGAERVERLRVVSAQCAPPHLERSSMEALGVIETALRGENDCEVVLRRECFGVILTEHASFRLEGLLVQFSGFFEAALPLVDDREIVG
jgi:hypothetical protein